MTAQEIDHLALLPGYLAAATAVAALIADLVGRSADRRRLAVLTTAGVGIAATAAAALWTGRYAARETFCVDSDCSWIVTGPGTIVAVLFCALTLGVLALSVDTVRPPSGDDPETDDAAGAPSGEYVFLLLCSMAGGVVLAYARDLITIVVALETLTLPLYVLVAMRRRAEPRRARESAEAAVTFLVVSVAASAVTLFGVAMLYAATGTVHLSALPAALEAAPAEFAAMIAVGVAMIVAGLAFKVAAAPLHGWAPGVYDRAPLPIAAYLSTASKLGGVAALVWVLTVGLTPVLHVAGPILAVLAAATMTVGNLGALRQTRAVRLLAWSSIAQAGYLLAPLGVFAVVAGREPQAVQTAAAAVLAFAALYVLLELTAFAVVVGMRGGGAEGGELDDYRGALRRSPWLAAVLGLALIGLAGLPPGLAGLFAKVTVISAVAPILPWLGVVIAVNAVIGLVYYLRFTLLMLAAPPKQQLTEAARRVPWPVAAVVLAAATALVVLGFVPQYVVDVVFDAALQ